MTLSLEHKPLALTPLLTPFNDNGPDLHAIQEMVRRQIVAGIDGIVVLDVVGEGQSLGYAERELVMSACIQVAKPYLRVIVATGTNSTATTIDHCRRAEKMGADGLLVTVPYYSKPTLAGTIDHFRQVAASVSVPVIIDDNPEMTASDHGNRLLEGMVPEPSIFGICHGHARLGHFTRLPDALRQRFFHFSRDDTTLAEFMRAGGNGAISPLGNVIPSAIQALISIPPERGRRSVLAEAIDAASRAVGHEGLPALKAVSALIGRHAPDVRLPLVNGESDAIARLRDAISSLVGEQSVIAYMPSIFLSSSRRMENHMRGAAHSG